MEFGYEERSKRFIERLDRIQNYLQSLPPLPKIGSVSRTEDQNRDQDSNDSRLHRSISPMSSESASSAGSSTTKQSVSTRLMKPIPKDELAPELLQRSPSLSPDNSRTSSAGVPTPTPSSPQHHRKKRRKDNRIQDPNKPTSRTSFGVDIGQGINMINYIKQNATPGSDAKNKRLAYVMTKSVPSAVILDKSFERVMYRQGPSSGGTSGTSIQLKNKGSAPSKNRPSVGKQMEFGSPRAESPITTTSDSDIYRVRYRERAIELPHHHGLDTLQELFVPYVEHHSYPEQGASRNESYYE